MTSQDLASVDTASLDPDTYNQLIANSPFGILRAEFSPRRYRVAWLSDFNVSGPLVHYTNLAGLVGIVESRGFWLSDSRFLNDSQEYINGAMLAQDILKRLAGKVRHRRFSVILMQASEKVLDAPKEASFVCSFSQANDSLDQWRAYAHGADGVSLVIDNSLAPSTLTKLPMFVPERVVYDDIAKARRILRVVRTYAVEFARDVAAGRDVDDDGWDDSLVRWLRVNFLLFKHNSFASEREVRLTTSQTQARHFRGIRHRVAGARIIPYLVTSDIAPPPGQEPEVPPPLPLTEVHIGPSATQQLTGVSVEAFLRNKGYTDTKVICSRVPYRG